MLARVLVLGLIVCCVEPVLSQSSLLASDHQRSPLVGANPYETNTSLYGDAVGVFPPAGYPHELPAEPVIGALVAEASVTRGFLDFPRSDGLGGVWRSTRPVRDRGILFSQTHRNPFEDVSNFSATLFADVLWERTFLLNIINPTGLLAEFLDEGTLKELRKISFAQEQVGFLFHAAHVYKKIAFSVDLPVAVIATHAWAPQSARDYFANLPTSDEPPFAPDQEKELSDLIQKIGWAKGLGDLKLGARVFDSFAQDRIFWSLGCELVLPLQSAAPAKRNLPADMNPVADNYNPEELDLLDPAERFKTAKRFLTMLQTVGTVPCIGQKSYGIGVIGALKALVHPTCTIYSSAQAYFQAPVKEYRLIHRYLDAGETTLAVEPGEFLVESHRGLMLRGTAGFDQKITKNFSCGLGGDVFFQNKETLYSEIFTASEKSSSMKDAAEMEQATQAIVFAHLSKKLGMFGGKGQFSLRASGSLGASGIGKLWNIGICLSSTF